MKLTHADLLEIESRVGHDALRLFGELQTADTIAYVKESLCTLYPQLTKLTPTESVEWLTEASGLLGLRPEVLIKEIEKQILRTYFIEQELKTIQSQLMDPTVSTYTKRSLLGTVLSAELSNRQNAMWIAGLEDLLTLTTKAWFTTLLIVLPFTWLMPGFHIGFVLITLWFVGGLFALNAKEKFTIKLKTILHH